MYCLVLGWCPFNSQIPESMFYFPPIIVIWQHLHLLCVNLLLCDTSKDKGKLIMY